MYIIDAEQMRTRAARLEFLFSRGVGATEAWVSTSYLPFSFFFHVYHVIVRLD